MNLFTSEKNFVNLFIDDGYKSANSFLVNMSCFLSSYLSQTSPIQGGVLKEQASLVRTHAHIRITPIGHFLWIWTTSSRRITFSRVLFGYGGAAMGHHLGKKQAPFPNRDAANACNMRRWAHHPSDDPILGFHINIFSVSLFL